MRTNQPLPWRFQTYVDDEQDPYYHVFDANGTVVTSNEQSVRNAPTPPDARTIVETMNAAWLRRQSPVYPPDLPEAERWHVEEAYPDDDDYIDGVRVLRLHFGPAESASRSAIIFDGREVNKPLQPDALDRHNALLASLAPEAIQLLAHALSALSHLSSDPAADAFLDKAAGLVLRAQKKEVVSP